MFMYSGECMVACTVKPLHSDRVIALGFATAHQRRLVSLLNYYRRHIADDVSTYSFART